METRNKNYDLRKLSKKYPDQWVALSRDHKKVVATGNLLRDVAVKAKRKDIVFLKTCSPDSFYMPIAF